MVKEAIIKVRVTETEREAWKEKAKSAGLSVSDLLRQSVGRVKTWTAKDRSIERDRIRELAKIGNNLNQIARWANTYKHAADAIQVIGHLRAIEQQLDSLSYRPKTNPETDAH